MGTVKRLLDVARGELGVKESPPNSNIVKYNDLYWGKGQYGNWAAWCAVFVWWCCREANIKLPAITASCGELMNAAKAKGMWVTGDFQPGDLVIFDWSGKKKTTNHVGIVESVKPGYGVVAIEGNTAVGNDSNGGEVMRRTREYKYIIGAVRPVFEAEEDVFDMTIDEFINNLSDEQAYTLLEKAQKHAATLPAPDWAKSELQEAVERGITDGGKPMQLIPRYQAAIMAKRAVR